MVFWVSGLGVVAWNVLWRSFCACLLASFTATTQLIYDALRPPLWLVE
jgi:hypothetical protein